MELDKHSDQVPHWMVQVDTIVQTLQSKTGRGSGEALKEFVKLAEECVVNEAAAKPTEWLQTAARHFMWAQQFDKSREDAKKEKAEKAVLASANAESTRLKKELAQAPRLHQYGIHL